MIAPENTPASFAAAARTGAQWVELDARVCGDGSVVVHHDAWIADGRAVADLDAEVLRAAGVWTLPAVLERLPVGVGLNVELKNLPTEPGYDDRHGLAARVADLVRDERTRRSLLLSSFDPGTAAACAEALPDVVSGLVHGARTPVADAWQVASECGLRALCSSVDATGLNAAMVDVLHGEGIAVMVWTVDNIECARRLTALGVDAICTNDVARLAAALR